MFNSVNGRFQWVFRNLAQIALNKRFRAHIQEAEYRSKTKKSKIRLGQVLSKTILHKCLALRWWAYTRNLLDTKVLFWSPWMQKVPTFLKNLFTPAPTCTTNNSHQLFDLQSLNGTSEHHKTKYQLDRKSMKNKFFDIKNSIFDCGTPHFAYRQIVCNWPFWRLKKTTVKSVMCGYKNRILPTKISLWVNHII